MALRDSVKIDLISKLNPNVFATLNQDVLGVSPLRLGSNQTAVKRMVVGFEHMLKMLMPPVLNLSPNDGDWYKATNNYWNSFSLSIYPGGKSLEIGFIYDLNDYDRKQFIAEAIKSTTKGTEVSIKSDADLKDFVLKKIPEFERYKYARPIDVIDYLTWVYVLGHHKVANKTTDITKSENIEFTLIDPRDILEQKRTNHQISNEALAIYLGLLPKRDTVNDLLYVIGEDPTILTTIDADMKLKNYCENNPSKFVELTKDPTTTSKARIERYVIAGILRKLPGTQIIVDPSDASIVIGNTLEEAVAYFNSEDKIKATRVQEYTTKYNSKKTQ